MTPGGWCQSVNSYFVFAPFSSTYYCLCKKKGTGLWTEQCSISRLTECVIINQQSFISDIPCSSKHLLRLYLELLLGSKHLWLDASWSTRDPHVQNFIQYEIIYISLLRSLPIVISLYLTISGSPETSILGYLHFQKPPYPHSYLLVNSHSDGKSPCLWGNPLWTDHLTVSLPESMLSYIRFFPHSINIFQWFPVASLSWGHQLQGRIPVIATAVAFDPASGGACLPGLELPPELAKLQRPDSAGWGATAYESRSMPRSGTWGEYTFCCFILYTRYYVQSYTMHLFIYIYIHMYCKYIYIYVCICIYVYIWSYVGGLRK